MPKRCSIGVRGALRAAGLTRSREEKRKGPEGNWRYPCRAREHCRVQLKPVATLAARAFQPERSSGGSVLGGYESEWARFGVSGQSVRGCLTEARRLGGGGGWVVVGE